ncbi:MAG TPA: prepilin-type N-terminal cleavage/methylation domain-containing protein [Desulfomonilaceae bacterium]|nr:prepilin-type N-terminal cleavage/methylation domain-containing protein [Desulfomonilaceae bacterium]
MENRSRGFTLVELMVSLVIFTLLVIMTLAFFVFQSKSAADSRSEKRINEMVQSALKLITNDIMHAGSGLTGHAQSYPQLGLWVYGYPSSTTNNALVVNWTKYMDFDAQPMAKNVAASNVAMRVVQNIFNDHPHSPAWIDVGATPKSSFDLDLVPDSVKCFQPTSYSYYISHDIGGMLQFSAGAVTPLSCTVTSSSSASTGSVGVQKLTFTTKVNTAPDYALLNSASTATVPAGAVVAPAITYKWKPYDSANMSLGGQLFRNDVAILGNDALGTQKIIAGDQFTVKSFAVQCKFFNPVTNGTTWSNMGADISAFDITQLKVVRVTITYTWRKRAQATKINTSYAVKDSNLTTFTSVIDVSPRCLANVGG